MADGTSETREKGAGEATSAPGAAVDAVFAATGIHPHAHLGTSSSSPGTPSGSELTRAGTAGSEQQPTDAEYAAMKEELEAEANALQAEIRATASQLEGLAGASAEGLTELLNMRGGIEEELTTLRREKWRLETMAELEELSAALGDAAECSASSIVGSDLDYAAKIAALRAKLEVAAHAAGSSGMGVTASAGRLVDNVDDDDVSALAGLDDVDALDAEIAAMEAKLEAARLSRDDMEAQRHALEQEMDAFMHMAMEDSGAVVDQGELAGLTACVGALEGLVVGGIGDDLVGGNGFGLANDLSSEPREEINP